MMGITMNADEEDTARTFWDGDVESIEAEFMESWDAIEQFYKEISPYYSFSANINALPKCYAPCQHPVRCTCKVRCTCRINQPKIKNRGLNEQNNPRIASALAGRQPAAGLWWW
jgi:hypothetical protein